MKCLICSTGTVKFKCPRCSISYCSSDCFKKHNPKCNEEFAKEQVIETAISGGLTEKNRENILRLLMLENSDGLLDEEEKETENLKKALKLIESGELEKAESLLSEAQKKQFEDFVSSGELDLTSELWTPWWEKNELITETTHTLFPHIPPHVPKLDEVMKGKQLHHNFKHNLLEVLYAYAYTLRVYDGGPEFVSLDGVSAAKELFSKASAKKEEKTNTEALFSIAEDMLEMGMTIIHISNVMNGIAKKPFCSALEALESAMIASQALPIANPIQLSYVILNDVAELVQCRSKVLRALWHTQSLCEDGSRIAYGVWKHRKKTNTFPPRNDEKEKAFVKTLKGVKVRLAPYLSFFADSIMFPNENFKELSQIVSELSISLQRNCTLATEQTRSKKPGTFITEVSSEEKSLLDLEELD